MRNMKESIRKITVSIELFDGQVVNKVYESDASEEHPQRFLLSVLRKDVEKELAEKRKKEHRNDQ